MSENATIPNSNLWTPDLPKDPVYEKDVSYGFRVEMLPDQQAPITVSGLVDDVERIKEETRDWLSESGKVRILDATEEPFLGEKLVEVETFVAVSREEFQQANVPEFFADINHISPDSAREYGIVGKFPVQESKSIHKEMNDQLPSLLREDWRRLPEYILRDQTVLSQIVSFGLGNSDDGMGKRVNLYVFLPEPLTEVQISKFTNGIRQASDDTGGTALGMPDVMALVPKRADSADRRAEVKDSSVIFYDTLIEEDKRWTEQIALGNTSTTLDNQSILLDVDEDPIQITTNHEWLHVMTDPKAQRAFEDAVGWEWRPVVDPETGETHWEERPNVDNPFWSGQKNSDEDMALVGEAHFAGGEWRKLIDDERMLALQGLFASLHSNISGPTFITAREMPLPTRLQKILPIRRPVAVRPSYGYSVYEESESELALEVSEP